MIKNFFLLKKLYSIALNDIKWKGYDKKSDKYLNSILNIVILYFQVKTYKKSNES